MSQPADGIHAESGRSGHADDREKILFVTGRLAEPVVRSVVEKLSREAGFDYEIETLGISVAALMHVEWIGRKLKINRPFDRVMLPGWCQGDVDTLTDSFGVPFNRGPKDIHDLPNSFGRERRCAPVMDEYDIEIIAEINHAPRLSDQAILAQAARYRSAGADVIDLGCVPGESWSRVGEVTRLLRRDGFRVSVDSFDRAEVETATNSGAELVLSCNRSNVDWAPDLGVELVLIPDDPADLSTLEHTVDAVQTAGVPFRIDPILDPIGFGFAASLERYYQARRRWPDAGMMMGIGNLTELTEVDTAGINVLLAAICQELGIHSVLTTEVINWARTAVAEFGVARRLVRHSLQHRTLPKHVDSGLVMLHDTRVNELSPGELEQLAARLTDPGFRVFVANGEIHLMNRDGYWHGADAFEVFDQAAAESPVDSSHAFYLGYELAKAATALQLGKQYTQDESLRWGMLTVEEVSAHDRRRNARQAGDL